MSNEKQERYRVRDQFVTDGYKASVIDTHGATNPELHEQLSLAEICKRLNDDERASTAERLDAANVNDRLDRLRADVSSILGVFIGDLQKHFLSLESSKQIVEHADGADSQTKKLGELRDMGFGPDPIPGADAPLFRWSPELLTDMVSARARRDGRAIKLSTYAGEIDRKSAIELRDWLDAVLDDRERWPTTILQAAKPGDVVFVEAQRDLSDAEMMSVKAMCESLSLSVKIVVLPKDMKVARPPEL